MERLAVFVTGVGGGGVGEQILKCLRLSDKNYFIAGGDMNRNSKGLLLVDQPYILPPANDAEYINTLLKICKKHDVKALFYGSEPELKAMSQNRECFEKAGIFIPLNPASVIETCMDKNKTAVWLQNQGFHQPRSVRITDADSLKRVDFIPAVLKPSVGSGGSVNTFIVRDENELEMFGTYLLGLCEEFIAQEYVGDADSEYTVGILSDMDGKYVNSIAVKKNILSGLSNKTRVPNTTKNQALGSHLVISSGISQGEIGRFPKVTGACRKIAEKMGCTGPVNIQCRFVNNKVYVFEINPRISGTSSLRALVGYNEPDVMIRKHLLGEMFEPDFSYRSGYIARGLEESLIEPAYMQAIPLASETDDE